MQKALARNDYNLVEGASVRTMTHWKEEGGRREKGREGGRKGRKEGGNICKLIRGKCNVPHFSR